MRPLTPDEFAGMFAEVQHTAFRLELQPAYTEPTETESVAAFLAGRPGDPADISGAHQWWNTVAGIVAGGGRVERVRVHEDPPTGYQQWLRWLDERWNRPAGEVIRYMTRQQAHDVGLLPAAGDTDWWLLDSRHLIVMVFDADGRRILTALEDDPALIVRANTLRDLAVHHSAPLPLHNCPRSPV